MITDEKKSGAAPYRAHASRSPVAAADSYAYDTDNDAAKTIAFIWATALVRFVIVCKRHEAFTADPLFAALLTFGIPAVLIASILVAAVRAVRASFGRTAWAS